MKLIIDIPEEEYKRSKLAYNYDSRRMDKYSRIIGKGTSLDDVKAEFINRYPTNWAGEPELGGAACHFSLCKVLQILDNIGKAEKHETCKGCLEPCIMYEPDMRACKHKVTEKGGE